MKNLRVIKGATPPQLGAAEYVWLDERTNLHSMVKVIEVYEDVPRIERETGWVPHSGSGSDPVLLHPAHYLPDPFRGQPSYTVLCEVKTLQDQPHPSNHRAGLRQALKGMTEFPKVSFEQTYLPIRGTLQTAPTAAAYRMAEKHLGACVDAGVLLQKAVFNENLPYWYWSFIVGPRDYALDPNEPEEVLMTVCDHLVIARFFLEKAARENDVGISYREGHLELELPEQTCRAKVTIKCDPYLEVTRLLAKLRVQEQQ